MACSWCDKATAPDPECSCAPGGVDLKTMASLAAAVGVPSPHFHGPTCKPPKRKPTPEQVARRIADAEARREKRRAKIAKTRAKQAERHDGGEV